MKREKIGKIRKGKRRKRQNNRDGETKRQNSSNKKKRRMEYGIMEKEKIDAEWQREAVQQKSRDRRARLTKLDRK